MARESTKELQNKIVANMKKWQKIENAAVSSAGAVIVAPGEPAVHHKDVVFIQAAALLLTLPGTPWHLVWRTKYRQ